MGSRELIESLRKTGSENVRRLRQDAEQEAAVLRSGSERALEALRRECEANLAHAVEEALQSATADANTRAREIRLGAEKMLADRLFSIALCSLSQLRGRDYSTIFEKLAAELPSLAWDRVSVNPHDVALAKRCFPDAENILGENVIGGMVAAAKDGAVRVVNTFEKRLERAWQDLLPEILKDVVNERAHDPSAAS